MNFSDAKTRAIQLINQYSNNGTVTINDTTDSDYLIRFPSLADDAQNEIADKVGIEAVCSIDLSYPADLTQNGYKKFSIPTDLKEHRFLRWDDESFTDFRIENGYLIIPEGYNQGVIDWSYYKYPTVIMSLATSDQDAYEFEVDAYTHYIIPYYMGGMVITDEIPSLSDKLLNLYYSKLQAMYKRNVNYPKRVRERARW